MLLIAVTTTIDKQLGKYPPKIHKLNQFQIVVRKEQAPLILLTSPFRARLDFQRTFALLKPEVCADLAR